MFRSGGWSEIANVLGHADNDVPRTLATIAAACGVAAIVLGGTGALVLSSRPTAGGGSLRRRLDHRLRGSVLLIREAVLRGWPQLLLGSTAYIVSQVLLLDLSLRTVGLRPPNPSSV